MRILEVPVYSIKSAIAAYEGGAHRLELCSHPESGGETPDTNMVVEILNKVIIPCMIMIRPRGGNFIYSDEEKQVMRQQVESFEKMPVAGFVFGALSETDVIDKDFCEDLIDLANGKPCTFHRAIDVVTDPLSVFEDVIACGFKRVLTSGGAKNALGGIENIKRMVSISAGRIIVMPGSGLGPDNIDKFTVMHEITEFHASCGKPKIDKSGQSFLSSASGETDKEIVRKMVAIITA